MKIKVYIVTYRNDLALNQCLGHLYESDATNYDLETIVVNNYGILNDIDTSDGEKIRVVNNQARPDWSHGHLARNWNECLIDGFVELERPDCDLVVLVQNDTVIHKNCFSNLIESHRDYDFIQAGVGDQFMSFTPDAVRHIGLFDERFCRVHQETDYFKAAISFHGEKSSINDPHHERLHNTVDDFSRNIAKQWSKRTGVLGAGTRFVEFAFSHCWDLAPGVIEDGKSKEAPTNQRWNSGDCFTYMATLFKWKWGVEVQGMYPSTPKIHRYFVYPYFEKDIVTLREQNYLFADNLDLIYDFRKKFGSENQAGYFYKKIVNFQEPSNTRLDGQ